MSLQSPLIDSRSQDDILQNVRTLAPFYTPEWDATQATGAGAALMEIFADLVDGLIQRLNEAPTNNLIAFLNMLGVQLLPAQPALVPLTFSLSSGATQPAVIPARSQAAANPPGGSPIIFETQDAILATPARIEAVLSVAPEIVGSDLILNSLAELQSGNPTRLFGAADQNLQNLQAHILYLGDPNLLNVPGSGKITLSLDAPACKIFNAERAHIAWRWIGANGTWHVFAKVIVNDDKSTVTLEKGPGEIQQASVNGVQSRWISAVGQSPHANHLDEISLTKVEVTPAPLAAFAPDAAFADDIPLPLPPSAAKPILPFGTLPRQGNAFYIASQEAFSKPGAAATLSFQFIPWPIVPVPITEERQFNVAVEIPLPAPPSPNLSWEYWNGAGWTVLPNVEDDALAQIAENHYALQSGGAGYQVGDVLTLVQAGGSGGAITVSSVSDTGPVATGAITYHGQSYTDGAIASVTGGSGTGATFTISASDGEVQSVAVSAGGSGYQVGDLLTLVRTGGGNATITVTAVASAIVTFSVTNVGTGYTSADGLSVTGGSGTGATFNIETDGSGHVTFTVPSDLQQTAIGGASKFWIRVRLASGDYGQVRYTPGNVPDASGVLYPKVSDLTVTYSLSAQTPSNVMTLNNGGFQVQTPSTKGVFPPFHPFVAQDDAAQALYLGFNQPPLNGPISIFFDLAEQAYPNLKPSLEWQYYSQSSGQKAAQWNRLAIVDGTKGLTTSGTVQFLGPADFTLLSRYGSSLFWIRAVDTNDGFAPPPLKKILARNGLVQKVVTVDTQVRLSTPPCDQQSTFVAPFGGGSPATSPAPLVDGIYLNTAWAIQAETISNELLGSSDASQNQKYQLTKFPVVSQQIEVDEFGALFASERNALAADKSVTTQSVTDANSNIIQFWIAWTPVNDLSTAGPTDRSYAIDPTFGTIQFGDGVNGAVPPIGFNNIRATYQYGGGSAGNVAAGAITSLRTTIPLVGSVNNPLAAGGGSDTETLDAALARGTESVKNRGRAVSAEDFEWITFSASRDVARVLVLPDFNDLGQTAVNWVTVLIVPGTSDPRPYPTFELQQIVQSYVVARAPAVPVAAGHVLVTGPTYVDVDISADLYPVSIDLAPQLETAALSALQGFLHPLTGSPSGQGWDFGALPCLSDFYGLLGAIPGVDHIENLTMVIYPVTPSGESTGAAVTISQSQPFHGGLPPYTLIASGNHTVTVKLTDFGSGA